tara:strand:- start:1286 stop:1744 length:459 start_codon:yes stop_codon:yes gene_type:complete
MSSTITSGTLKVTITEQVILNGRDQGSKNTLSIGSINEVVRRIFTTNGTAQTVVLNFAATADGTRVADGDVRYVRITNLDDTNFATLVITGDNSTSFSVRLDPGASYLVTSTSTTGTADYADISGTTLEDLSQVQATADTAAVDLEVFVASA